LTLSDKYIIFLRDNILKKIAICIFLILLFCCKKNNEIVEYKYDNYNENIKKIDDIRDDIILYGVIEKSEENKELNEKYIRQINSPQEEIIYKNKFEILNKIDEYIVEKKYDKAKEIINNIDINKYIGGLYSLLKDDSLKAEEKVKLIKYLVGESISNPYILYYLYPSEYDIFVNEFSLNINNPIDELGRSILHAAVRINNTELLDYLLLNGVNINLQDINGHNALFYAFEFHPIDWYNPVIENESYVGINWANNIYSYGQPYYSISIVGTENRRLYVINKLLESGINVNQKTNYSWTILHFSVFVTTEYVYNIFLSYNADENLLTEYGRTSKDLRKYIK
jgi:ankyrin repeat protein